MPPEQVLTYQVFEPQTTPESVVPLRIAWQIEFACTPVHVRPMTSFVPLIVIDEYVPVSDERNVFHAVQLGEATFVVNAPVKVTPPVHTPAEQNGVCPLQVLPQPPQLAGFVRTSVQVPLQFIVPTAQHFPCVHHSAPEAHAVPQFPQ